MPELTTEQETLFGPREVDYGIVKADNRDLYPYLKAVGRLVGECQLDVSVDGLRVNVTDPAYVGMLDLSFSGADPSFDAPVGLLLDDLVTMLQNKPRSSESVEVALHFGRPSSTLNIEREYANGQVWDITERFTTVDSASIRQPTL